MDGSFLSDDQVIEASREFVCIRIATYENADEVRFLKSIYRGRSGEVENTTFAILSPNGREALVRSGRGPQHAFRNASSMARGMQRLARDYQQRKSEVDRHQSLPHMETVDLALNVASADQLPVIVAVSKSAAGQAQLTERLKDIAWSETIMGQFVFCAASKPAELKPIAKAPSDVDYLIVEPGTFGITGRVLGHFNASDDDDLIRDKMTQVIRDFPRNDKDHATHCRIGIQLGLEWETVVPETDAQANRAKERARGR